jgi:selenocysteine-specific elongation factor
VSAKSGEGLNQLKTAIVEGLRDLPGRDPEALARLPVDRVFSMKGFGTVVTGTLWAGSLRPGDDVEALPALPGAQPGKVRGAQVHGEGVAQARAGNRTALNVTMAKKQLSRGQVLARPGELAAGRLVDVRIQYLATCKKALKRRARLLLHAGTAQTLATVSLLDAAALEPGQSGLAQLMLDEPMVMLPGDRFILRGFVMQRHHGTTLGGGVVLRTLGARLRRGTPEMLATLRENERALDLGAREPDLRVRLEVERAGRQGIARAALQMRLPFSPRVTDGALTRLATSRALVRYDKERGACIARPALDELARDAIAAVDAFHAAQPLVPGMPREELRAKVSDDVKLLHLVLESLAADGALVVERDTVRRPGHDPARTRAQQDLAPLAERTLALFREAGLQPPRPVEAAAALGVDARALQPVLDMLARGGSLVRVKDLLFLAAAIDELREKLRAHLQAKREITPQEWKELVGASRKFTIPLAEHFDAEKLTMRVGEVRKLRGLQNR